MGLGSMLFGDPERKRREKQQADLDADYYKRARAVSYTHLTLPTNREV